LSHCTESLGKSNACRDPDGYTVEFAGGDPANPGSKVSDERGKWKEQRKDEQTEDEQLRMGKELSVFSHVLRKVGRRKRWYEVSLLPKADRAQDCLEG
jgi:hypothetical protein